MMKVWTLQNFYHDFIYTLNESEISFGIKIVIFINNIPIYGWRIINQDIMNNLKEYGWIICDHTMGELEKRKMVIYTLGMLGLYHN